MTKMRELEMGTLPVLRKASDPAAAWRRGSGLPLVNCQFRGCRRMLHEDTGPIHQCDRQPPRAAALAASRPRRALIVAALMRVRPASSAPKRNNMMTGAGSQAVRITQARKNGSKLRAGKT